MRLKPVEGLEFFEHSHRYRFRGQWIDHSITQVIDDKTDAVRQIIEDTRHEWEPRGNFVHDWLDHWLTTGEEGPMGDFAEWIKPLRDLGLWSRYDVVATEFAMVDPRYSIAGKFDVLLQHKTSGDIVLADLKTLSERGRPRNIEPQLGGYLILLGQTFPEMEVKRCLGIWAKPGECVTTTYDAMSCWVSFEAARRAFLKNQPDC